jgi:L-ascorbate metabolism protein UlaG (beta-lactamase superfamily)
MSRLGRPSATEGEIEAMKLKLFRHVTLLLMIDDRMVLVDPMYMKRGRLPPIPTTLKLKWNPLEDFSGAYPELSEADIVLITHHHFDHFDRVAASLLPKGIPIVTPRNGARRLRRMGFHDIHAMNAGEQLVIDRLRIRATPVKHAQRLGRLLYNPGVGYLIEASGGNIFISGDTTYFAQLVADLRGCRIDVAILYGGGARLPIFGRHTLSHREVLLLGEHLDVRDCVVVHLESLNHCPEGRRDLEKLMQSCGTKANVIAPLPGEELSF